ncbi:unnamed protein product [Microthlaspi erraticum]|uniref:MBD domain-containing protein n=1 Tax=Microthlaspi erraticum TaxID=1685480 RepID=A0A6D2L4B5_9BRAS|nr:unnamed protein product [Microthlaspi erraticum]
MDGEGISDGVPAERKVETRVKKKGRKVTVEKSAAEGLPEGWIKKIIITNRPGRKDRRDPFFIDPKSEYIFQSFKDASRYVETGNLGHYARKLKESDIEDDDSGLLLEPGDDLLQRNGKGINLLSSPSDEHSENCKVNMVLEDLGNKEEAKDVIEKQPIAKRVTRSQAKATKKEEVDNNVKSRLRSASSQSPVKKKEVRDSTEKQITRSEPIVMKKQKKKKKKKKKNELTNSVARRTSKRLAGIELEPTPELKTRAKSQRIVPPLNLDDGTPGKCKQPVDLAVTGGLQNTDIIPLNEEVASEQSSPKPDVCVEMEVQIEKICEPLVSRSGFEGDNKEMKTPLVWEQNPVFHLDGYKHKEEMSPVSPLSGQTCATKREKTTAATAISPLSSNVGRGNNSSQVMEKNANTNSNSFSSSSPSSSSAFDSTLADLWKDPCIAFAIKTLTGEESLTAATTSSDPNNNNQAKQKEVAVFSPETLGNVNTGSAYTSEDIWKDPCIEFAIKTLTGAIPIEPDARFKPRTSAAMQEHGGRQRK